MDTHLRDTYKHKGKRERLVNLLEQIGITDQLVLSAIGKVPRHIFMEGAFSDRAYENIALPIKEGQTISQPFTVAFQTQLLELKPKMKVLEIGTGSGYQASILCEMGMRVFSVEINQQLHYEVKQRLADLGYHAHLSLGDGSIGWKKFQPYDAIIVTAASPSVPTSLKRQLEIGGRLVIPVGDQRIQKMTVITRIATNKYHEQTYQDFKFVLLRGKYGFKE